ncbi:MAG: DUF4974 domain-containing protein, partial [Bacteroidetes bacterium]|nr:DUF4974 domain-containing protein [Bacteroidota bacterium]
RPGSKDSLFLKPGEELRYSNRDKIAFIQNASVNTNTNNKPATIKGQQDTLSFTRVPLPDVFEKLMLQYHVTITYNRDALAAMNFTGAITSSDSLSVVLKAIAQMNGLTVTEKDGAFGITP